MPLHNHFRGYLTVTSIATYTDECAGEEAVKIRGGGGGCYVHNATQIEWPQPQDLSTQRIGHSIT